MNVHHTPHPWPTAPVRKTSVVDPIVLLFMFFFLVIATIVTLRAQDIL